MALTLTFPGFFVITTFTSMGNVVLPIAFAFGILLRRVAGGATAATDRVRERAATPA